MQTKQPLISDHAGSYRKLYFIWYFDDEKGYGIEVFGEKPQGNDLSGSDLSGNDEHSKLYSIVNWTFGHGTWARDLRRSWGDFAANKVAENQGTMPPEIKEIVLDFNIEKQIIEGNLETVEGMLKS
ncbi:hypothetical protein [Desulfitobacterium sp.]|uniref:hypothetical protein n=1 Tax=Desulfitobacterium sp. TaxID=49981 RepID=UPI002B1F2C2A|nr:hypothetical protein [Desulfitobacterium sp.]MEA4902188.1 hypothetical protein [Desulfitobacterium sp.]